MTDLTTYSGPRVPRSDPLVARILAATFPDYRGRKVELRLWVRPRRLDNYWSGGTRSYWRFLDSRHGVIATPTNDNPFEKAAHEEVDLPAGWLAVEHIIFCGKDLGIRIYARVEDLPPVLTEGGAR